MRQEVDVATALTQLAGAFYERASEAEEGRRMLQRVAPAFLSDCVFDFDIEDGPGLYIVYQDGRLSVHGGRYSGQPAGLEEVLIEMRGPDFEDLLEARIGVAEAHRERKYFLAVQPELNLRMRAYVCLWGVMTRIGQEAVSSDKARRTAWMALQTD